MFKIKKESDIWRTQIQIQFDYVCAPIALFTGTVHQYGVRAVSNIFKNRIKNKIKRLLYSAKKMLLSWAGFTFVDAAYEGGRGLRIFLEGEDVSDDAARALIPTRWRTTGWVDLFRLDDNGKWVIEDGSPVKYRKYGVLRLEVPVE